MTEARHPDEAFEKLLGKPATEEQRNRLYEVRDALGLANNDALWLVLVALEHYKELYGEQPARITAEATKVLGEVRVAFAAAAEAEAARSHRSLAEAVAATSIEIAARKTDAAKAQAYCAAAAGLVLHGSLCLLAGFSLGRGEGVPWARGGHLLSAVMGAPAGWMVFVLLLPIAAYWVRGGSQMAKQGATRSERAMGWTVTVLTAVVGFGSLLALIRLL